jgi:ubiquitin-conjugating enzyme E2 variant
MNLMSLGNYSLQLFLALSLADFIAGVIHWLEDSYGSPDTPIVGKPIKANILHHHDPRDFLRNNWWQNARSSLPIVLFFAVVFHLLDCLNFFTISTLIIGWNANEIHKWAHQTKRERPRFATYLQNLGIILSPKHHYKHHRSNHDTDYCVITPWVNPLLNLLNFWRFSERLIYKLTGIRTRLDPVATQPVRRPTC